MKVHPLIIPQLSLLSLGFVLIWSTGFLVARLGMPHAEPLTFLSLRFGGTVVLMLLLVQFVRAPWPSRALAWRLAVAGVLLQAGYLIGVWAAVKLGMGAGLVALIMGLQPILTAWFAGLARESVSPRQWLGLLLGLLGVMLVVIEQVQVDGITTASLALAGFALASITAGTLWQRRECPNFDLRTGSVIQFGSSLLVSLPLALMLETQAIDWGWPVAIALGWSILGLSIGAISLLFLLIRRGTATQVSSLLYLTPPTTAIMAWLLFDEPFRWVMLVGLVLTGFAIWLVSAKPEGVKVDGLPPTPKGV